MERREISNESTFGKASSSSIMEQYHLSLGNLPVIGESPVKTAADSADSLFKDNPLQSLESFIEQTKSKLSSEDRNRLNNTIERLKEKDGEFATAALDLEITWLSDGNTVLKEFMDAIRTKIKDKDTTMTELLKGVEILSKELKLHFGMPTNIMGHKHKLYSKMDDNQVNSRIKELQDLMSGKVYETSLTEVS